jgi:large subunit ribosomal protein L10
MPSTQKVQVVADLQSKIAQAQSIVFAKYSGLSVAKMQELRSKVKEAGGEITVARNRLVDVALNKPSGLGEKLQDQLLTLFSYVDPVSPVKALYKFIEDNELPEVKAGFMDNKVLEIGEVDALSKMATKNEMIATLLRTLQAPAYGLRNVLEAGPRNLTYALSAIAKKKEEAGQ